MLCVIATTGATVFAAAAPAFAAPAHKPQAKVTGDQIAERANADLQSASSYRIYSSSTVDGLTFSVSATATVQGCLLTLNTGDGISEKILDIGTSEWVKPSNAFWAALGYTGNVLAYLEGKVGHRRCVPQAVRSIKPPEQWRHVQHALAHRDPGDRLDPGPDRQAFRPVGVADHEQEQGGERLCLRYPQARVPQAYPAWNH
jgi:hypothetical protein